MRTTATFVLAAALASAQTTEWPHYGGDAGGTRYSPLRHVNRGNVFRLKPVWTFHTGDFVVPKKGSPHSAFQATPLLADGVLYVPTPFGRVIALDPATGRPRWTFDPKIDRAAAGGDGLVCRGLATWKDPATGERLLFLAAVDARLFALRASDGRPLWQTSLAEGVGQTKKGEYHVTSPPTVLNGRVIVGSAIDDNARTTMPSGVVRAFDARTGKMLWHWDPIPNEKNSGAANAWSVFSADPERDLVFIPTGSASPDHYGGERPGDNRWANSVVALRGATGQLAWGFQTVHHDLWDYDVPAQPVLATVKGQPAVIQATKTGQIFVLHRETGTPIFPVTERPVPVSDVPGEKAWPTQPFSALPSLVEHRALRPDDAWGLLYFDRKGCADRIASLRAEGIFTPPSLRGTVDWPGIVGGTNWGSAAWDPEQGTVIANTTNMAFVLGIAPREKLAETRKLHPEAEFSPMRGTPYIMWREPLLSPIGMPCAAPPWGTLSAVDLNTGKLKWRSTLGTIRDIAPVPVPARLGTPNLGGPLATAGGLVFIGAALDNYLRAFDSRTGTELWAGRLPAGGQATPMTYSISGRQFIVIAAGGHGRLGTKVGDSVVAFALP